MSCRRCGAPHGCCPHDDSYLVALPGLALLLAALVFLLGYAVGRPDGARYDCRDKPANHP